MIKELKGQPRWSDLGLMDLRTLDANFRLDCPGYLDACEDLKTAVLQLKKVFGFDDTNSKYSVINTEIGQVEVKEEHLVHIVEKRKESRERYASYAKLTLDLPYEIWKVAYDQKNFRYAFIGVFKSKTQMLVIVSISDGNLFWNFMHCEAKKLNKHRQGELVFSHKKSS